MTRLDPLDPRQPSDIIALDHLHRAGWSIGDMAAHDGAGGLAWIVWGSNGENLIRAEGATGDEAWAGAVEQARALQSPVHQRSGPAIG